MPDPDVPPLFDARAAVGGQPAAHALIVGVSSYPYLRGGLQAVADPWDMPQLSTAANSAFKIYRWLRTANDQNRLPVPLATCRLLLSPSAGEGALAGMATPATLDNFSAAAKGWRRDCKTHRDNMALFYFAGHGVQRTVEDAVLCLEDFRNPAFGGLAKSAALANIRGGMAPAPECPDIARTQIYVVDACRVRPEQFSRFENMGTTDIFDVSLASKDDRSSPIYFAAIPNQVANAVPGDQSLFSRALIDCLDGEAGQAQEEDMAGNVPWAVTVNSLSEQLDSYKIDALNRDFQADQTYAPGGQFRDRVICYLDGPPLVRFSLRVIPDEARNLGRMTFGQAGQPAVVDVVPIAPDPVVGAVPGGIYRLEISFNPPNPLYQPRARDYELRPARFEKSFKVG